MSTTIFSNQEKKYTYTNGGETLIVEVKFDDECGNGHNTLSVTGTLYDNTVRRWGPTNDESVICFGCIHDIIRDPRFGVDQAVLDAIPYHLMSTDGPMHYLANVMFHASDRDCWGHRNGEPSKFSEAFFVANSPVAYRVSWQAAKKIKEVINSNKECYVSKVSHKNRPGETYEFAPKYTVLIGDERDPEWYECPWDTCEEASEWMDACLAGAVRIERIATGWSVGKPRDLKSARSAAIADVPEGHPLYLSDAQLTDDANLEGILEARIPLLQSGLKSAVLGLGLLYGDEAN